MNELVTKTALRTQARAVLAGVTRAALEHAGKAIAEHVQAHPLWQSARSVGVFAPLSGEIPLHDLINAAWRAGKRVGFPQVTDRGSGQMRFAQVDAWEALVVGAFGIREPQSTAPTVPPAALDLLLVPGLAFAPNGARLGRGAGFYDRYVADCPATRIGVALAQQLVPTVPMDATDVPMAWVVTELGWTACT